MRQFSCRTLALILLAFLLLGVVLMVLLVRKVKAPSPPQALPGLGLSKPAAELTIKLSDVELGQALQVLLANPELKQRIIGESYEFGEPAVKTEPVGQTLTLEVLKPFKSRLEIFGRPVAKNGQLVFEIERVKAGGVKLPARLARLIEGRLSRLLAASPLLQGFYLTDIELGEGFLVLKGRR